MAGDWDRRRRKNLNGRFWANVSIGQPDQCWLWQRRKNHDGYGEIMVDGRKLRAHRVSWSFENGEIPKGSEICHTCDNRACCNPAHLLAASHAFNIADMMAKGRQAVGEAASGAKLLPAQVREIRRAVGSQRQIGEQFGISGAQVGSIRRRVSWRHLPDGETAIG